MKKYIRLLTVFYILINLSCIEHKQTLTPLSIFSPGNEKFIDYTKYGNFVNPGTTNYKYVLKNKTGLIKAIGEGIYPANKLIYKNPIYKKLKKENKISKDHWRHLNTTNFAVNFFTWVSAKEEPGVKLFMIAEILRRSGHLIHALKAYHAITVFFPGSACWSIHKKWVWYVGPVAIDRIRYLCRKNPDLGVQFTNAWIEIKNMHDTNLQNDIVTVTPGKFINEKVNNNKIDLTKVPVISQRGKGKVHLKKYKNKHWQLIVDNKPFIVKGINYAPTKIGESPHDRTMRNWQFIDDNKNGIIDLEEVWIDKNKNNKKDRNETITSDFQLLKDMGCNAIRYFHKPPNNIYNSKKQFNKKLLRKLFYKYGIRIIMGDFLGAYTIGSGADWQKGTDYTDPEQRKRMKESLRQLVLDHKDEPYVLMWLLGNENNMPSSYTEINTSRTLAASQPKEFATFVNECAKMIHKLDPNHPVALGNAGLSLIKSYNKYAPEIDIIAINSYRGKLGFGDSLWLGVQKKFDRPILISEYGCDVWDSIKEQEDETSQAIYHKGNWEDILYNTSGNPGYGNVLGGVIFEYLDEWWKSLLGPSYTQQDTGDCPMAFPDGWSSEEYLGIVSQGNGSHSPYLRQLRKAYFYYKKAWNK